MRDRALAALVALALLVPGCFGTDSGGQPPTTPLRAPGSAPSGANGPAMPTPPGGGYMLALASMPPRTEVVWSNGTFEPTDAAFPVGAVAGLAGVPWDKARLTDITDKVPSGIPTRIIVQADAAMAQGDLDIWMQVGDNEWWTGDWDTPFGGYSRFEAVIVRAGVDPIQVAILYDEPEPAASVDYALRIEVGYDPARFPVGPAYGLTLSPGDRLRFTHEERTGPGPARASSAVLLWGPDDLLRSRTPFTDGVVELALPGDARAGEYVVSFAQGRGDVAIEVVQAAAAVSVRRLGASFTLGDPVEVPPGEEEVTWAFDVTAPPLLVGFFSWQGPLLGTAVTGRMESPAGVLFDFEFTDGGPFLMPGVGSDSGYSAEALVLGTYTATAGFGTTVPHPTPSFTHFIVGYQR